MSHTDRVANPTSSCFDVTGVVQCFGEDSRRYAPVIIDLFAQHQTQLQKSRGPRALVEPTICFDYTEATGAAVVSIEGGSGIDTSTWNFSAMFSTMCYGITVDFAVDTTAYTMKPSPLSTSPQYVPHNVQCTAAASCVAGIAGVSAARVRRLAQLYTRSTKRLLPFEIHHESSVHDRTGFVSLFISPVEECSLGFLSALLADTALGAERAWCCYGSTSQLGEIAVVVHEDEGSVWCTKRAIDQVLRRMYRRSRDKSK